MEVGGGGLQVGAATELLTKKHQNRHQIVIFNVMSEVQKDSDDISAGIGKFLRNPKYKNFVRNLTSKLTRSTLTSLGRIRVKVMWSYTCSNFWESYTPPAAQIRVNLKKPLQGW
jgi:hypothetical protein